MTQAFIRGLALLEAVDRYGPIGISDLARRLDADKAGVSRLITAAVRDGWIERRDGKVVIGPRASLLGHGGSLNSAAARIEPVVAGLAGVSGTLVQAVALVGSDVVAVATSGTSPGVPGGLQIVYPLWITASSKVVASQVAPVELERLLPVGPELPSAAQALDPVMLPWMERALGIDATAPGPGPESRTALLAELEGIRADGSARDLGALHPELGCLSVPWPGAGTPAAIGCIGRVEHVASRIPFLEGVLRVAVAPGATREDVVRSAALHLT